MAKAYLHIPDLTPQDIQRFWNSVDKTPGQGPKGECWTWKLKPNKNGYCVFSIFDGRKNFLLYTHRIAFFIANGTIDDNLNVCHSCDYRICCNPNHLWQGTHKQNSQDMTLKGRSLQGRQRPNISGDKHGARKHPESRPRGDNHSRTKIPDSDIPAIRARYATGEVSLQSLANEYGVTRQCIRSIVIRQNRKHVE